MDADALRRGAAQFQALVSQAAKDGKASSADSLRLRLTRKYPVATRELEKVYIHPGRFLAKEMLKWHFPRILLTRAALDGAAVFGTEDPRLYWVITPGSINAQGSLCFDAGDVTFHVYHLSDITGDDLCQMIQ